MTVNTESHRVEAVSRIVGLVVFVLVSWLIVPLAIVAGLAWMLVDVSIQLVVGREGWRRHPVMGGVADLLARLAWWPVDMLQFIVFGDGDFPIIPRSRGS